MTWHKASTGNHQALIIEEETGETIAVVYDGQKHADLIAAAPELLEALEEIQKIIYAVGAPLGSERYFEIRHVVCEASQKAKGE